MRDTLATGNGLSHEDVVELVVREGPERVRALMDLGARFSEAHGAEGKRPRSTSRARAGTARGASSTRATSPAARYSARSSRRCARTRASASASTTWPSISSSSPERSAAPRRVVGAYVLDERHGRGRTRFVARATVLATRRRRQGLPLHDEPRRRDRRRRRDGLPRGRDDREHGVLPVPPDVPLPPAGEELPHQRGAARRRRRAAAPGRRRRSWSATTR